MKINDLINDNVAFHCDTKEKAVEFLHKAHELGYMWRYIDEDSNCYNTYGCDTCYKLSANGKIISFSELNYFKKSNHTIIEYELDKLTPIEYLMWYWGIKEGEKFNIIFDNGSKGEYNPYTFSNGILKDKDGDESLTKLLELIRGKATIEKLAWKPIGGDLVWYIGEDRCVYDVTYTGIAADLAMLKNGWFFRTKAEAESNKERIMKEYAEVLGDD